MSEDQLVTVFESHLVGGQSMPWLGALIDGVRAMEASPASSSLVFIVELASAAQDGSNAPSRLAQGRSLRSSRLRWRRGLVFNLTVGARSPARLRSRCDRCRRGPGTCAGGRHGRDWMVGNRPSFTCAGSRWASRTRRAQRRSCRIRRTGECGSERQCRAKRGLQRTRPCRTTRQRRPKT